MKIGIVGSEAAKFTAKGEADAKALIRDLLVLEDEVISGGCHLGGIDQWAAEIGRELGLKVTEYLPENHTWTDGYRERNLLIAGNSDVVHCITVDKLPEGYIGMRFTRCYHCNTNEHVKSGGCWTMHRAKRGVLHVVKNR